MLRPQQQEVLDWIIRFTLDHGGVGPMQRHICAGLGVKNPHHTLKSLQRRGYLSQPYDGGPYLPQVQPLPPSERLQLDWDAIFHEMGQGLEEVRVERLLEQGDA